MLTGIRITSFLSREVGLSEIEFQIGTKIVDASVDGRLIFVEEEDVDEVISAIESLGYNAEVEG